MYTIEDIGESKQREKYETNQINKNIGSGVGFCGIAGANARTDDNDNNEHRPGDRHNDNPTDDHQLCGKHRHLHSGLGSFYVPNGVGCGARALLLHEGYDGGRSGGSHCNLVGSPSRHAGHRLLLNGGRPGCGAQSSIGATCATSCRD